MKFELRIKKGVVLSPSAFRLLICCLPKADKYGFISIAPQGYAKSTFYRLMNELCSVGIAEKVDTGYRIDTRQASKA